MLEQVFFFYVLIKRVNKIEFSVVHHIKFAQKNVRVSYFHVEHASQ